MPQLLRILALCICLFPVVVPAQDLNLAVYYPDYRYRTGAQPDFYGTTNLILFTAAPNEDGAVDFGRLKPTMITMAKEAKARHPQLKVTYCVGGWGRGNVFGQAVETEAKRQRFVAELATFCEEQQLDGVDIDWEFPKTEEEYANFTLFLQELSAQLKPRNQLLTVAIGYTRPLPKEAYEFIDQVNLMCYQPWNPPQDSYADWLEAAVQKALDAGLPPEKLNIGLPFFAKEMGGDRRAYSWKNLAGPEGMKLPESEHGFSPAGKEICDLRLQLVKKHGLGGVMVWDFGHDTTDPEHSLLKHLSEQMAAASAAASQPSASSNQ